MRALKIGIIAAAGLIVGSAVGYASRHFYIKWKNKKEEMENKKLKKESISIMMVLPADKAEIPTDGKTSIYDWYGTIENDILALTTIKTEDVYAEEERLDLSDNILGADETVYIRLSGMYIADMIPKAKFNKTISPLGDSLNGLFSTIIHMMLIDTVFTPLKIKKINLRQKDIKRLFT